MKATLYIIQITMLLTTCVVLFLFGCSSQNSQDSNTQSDNATKQTDVSNQDTPTDSPDANSDQPAADTTITEEKPAATIKNVEELTPMGEEKEAAKDDFLDAPLDDLIEEKKQGE